MKVTQEFAPVSIVLETRAEYNGLMQLLQFAYNRSPVDGSMESGAKRIIDDLKKAVGE